MQRYRVKGEHGRIQFGWIKKLAEVKYLRIVLCKLGSGNKGKSREVQTGN